MIDMMFGTGLWCKIIRFVNLAWRAKGFSTKEMSNIGQCVIISWCGFALRPWEAHSGYTNHDTEEGGGGDGVLISVLPWYVVFYPATIPTLLILPIVLIYTHFTYCSDFSLNQTRLCLDFGTHDYVYGTNHKTASCIVVGDSPAFCVAINGISLIYCSWPTLFKTPFGIAICSMVTGPDPFDLLR